MGLLIYEQKKEFESRIKDLKVSIKKQREDLPAITHPNVAKGTKSRIEKLESYIKFIESNPNRPVTIFPMTNEGKDNESWGNVTIFLTLSKGGSHESLKDKKKITKINSYTYKKTETSSSLANYTITNQPNIFKWWENAVSKNAEESKLKGLVKLNNKYFKDLG